MLRTLLLSFSLLLSACSPPEEPLRIAINPWPGYEFLYLAERLNLYEAEGVKVRVLQFSSLNDARRAYEQGKVDGFAGTPVELLAAAQNSRRRPRVVYLTDYSNGGDMIIAGRQLEGVEALAGKRVGVEVNTLNTYVLARALQHHGLSLAQVNLVSLPQTAMEEALAEGTVDAVVSYPPYSVRLLRNPRLQRLFDTREIPGEVLDLLAIDDDVLQQRGPAVRALLRGMARAMEHARAHPEEAYAIMAAREGLTPEEFRQAIEEDLQLLGPADQARFHGPQGLLLKALQATQQVMLETGQLRSEQDLHSLIGPAAP